MSEYISRQAAISALDKCLWGVEWDKTLTDTILRNMPSADVQPVRRGKWIEYDNSHCECPFCHTEWSYFENMVECFNFCPNCGARMDGE